MKSAIMALVVALGGFLPSACVIGAGERERSWAAVPPASPVPRSIPLRDRFARGRLELLRAINSDRAAAGLRPVVLDSLATVAAQHHAEAMATGGFLSHYDVRGRAPYERMAALGGTGHVIENVYRWRERNDDPLLGGDPWHRFDPRTAQAALLSSAPHRAAILDPHRTGVGIGFAVDRRENAVFVVQEFIARHATLVAPPPTAQRSSVRLWGRVLGEGVGPLLFVVRREVNDGPAPRRDAPPPGPYDDGGVDPRIVPPWAIAVLPDGRFALDLAAELRPGRYYAVLYVAPSREIEIARARRRAYPSQGWPGAAVVFEVRAS